MKGFRFKIFVMVVAFIASATITVFFNRVKEEDSVIDANMATATLPVVYMVSDEGQQYNLLHGYITNIDASMLHECMTPLNDNRKLTIRVNAYEQNVKSISYEVRSLDGEEYLENTVVTDFYEPAAVTGDDSENVTSEDTENVTMESQNENASKLPEGNVVEAVLGIKNLLEDGQQYRLKITVTTDKNSASFYTRIMLGGDVHLDEKLSYVKHFSEVTFDDEAIKEIIPKLEPSSAGDNTNLGHVNIHSKLSQVGWGKLQPVICSEVWPYVVEIEGKTADIRLDYQVSAEGTAGVDYYDVKEFFRINRADENTTYVYGYDRWVDQIFDGVDDLNDSGRIYLGITSGLYGDMQLKGDVYGKVTCFVRRGELWSYSTNDNIFTRIFSFADDNSKYDSLRESYNQYDIKIMDVTGTGDVRFVVYGYMNRGAHEGEMGISVCTYSAEENTVEEVLYIPRDEIFDVIKEDVNRLVYLNDEGRFFVYNDGTIYSIDCDTKEYMVVSANPIGDSCFLSESSLVFAYQEGADINESTEIKLIKLATGETSKIEAGNDHYIKSLGLIDGNLIYGEAIKSEIYYDAQGNKIFPMYLLQIIDGGQNVVKKYQMSGVRVVDAYVEDSKLQVSRVQIDGDGNFIPIQDDHLFSKSTSSDNELYVKEVSTDVRQKESYIILRGNVPSAQLAKVCNSKPVKFNGGAMLYLEGSLYENICYRTYGIGELRLMSTSLGEAIKCADEWAGVVTDTEGYTVWDRNKSNSASVKLPETGYKLGACLDITGCTLDEALYFISEGMVLRTRTEDNGYVLVYGYDKSGIMLIEESLGMSYTYTRTDFSGMLDATGGIIYAYEISE